MAASLKREHHHGWIYSLSLQTSIPLRLDRMKRLLSTPGGPLAEVKETIHELTRTETKY
jgi:hypothetical protein